MKVLVDKDDSERSAKLDLDNITKEETLAVITQRAVRPKEDVWTRTSAMRRLFLPRSRRKKLYDAHRK